MNHIGGGVGIINAEISSNKLIVALIWADMYCAATVVIPNVGRVKLPPNLVGKKTYQLCSNIILEIER
jgi:hypothetical protein